MKSNAIIVQGIAFSNINTPEEFAEAEQRGSTIPSPLALLPMGEEREGLSNYQNRARGVADHFMAGASEYQLGDGALSVWSPSQ